LTDKEKAGYYRRFSGLGFAMNAFVIDTFEFCRLKERRTGELAVKDLPRLAEESVGQAGTLSWSLQGGTDGRGYPQIALSVSGSIQLTCQRCLKPFAFDFASDALLVVANDEANADELDALLADEPVEVIVGSRNFSIVDLIEDEALLAIPSSPRHQTCPDDLVPAFGKSEEKVSPFAVLKNLKQ
jgi:uncharacterized protein